MNEYAYNTLNNIAKGLKNNTVTDINTLLKDNGYDVKGMYEHGFRIDYKSDKSILEQAEIYCISISEMEY